MQRSTNMRILNRLVAAPSQRLSVLLVLAAVLAMCAAFTLEGQMQRAAFAVSLSLLCVCGLVVFVRFVHGVLRAQGRKSVTQFVTNDSAPSFIALPDGQIMFSNASAVAVFVHSQGATLGSVLADRLGNAEPVLFRLQSRALLRGAAREEIVTHSGSLMLAVHSIGADGFAWRVELLYAQDTAPLGGRKPHLADVDGWTKRRDPVDEPRGAAICREKRQVTGYYISRTGFGAWKSDASCNNTRQSSRIDCTN